MNDADANDHPMLWGHTMPGELDAGPGPERNSPALLFDDRLGRACAAGHAMGGPGADLAAVTSVTLKMTPGEAARLTAAALAEAGKVVMLEPGEAGWHAFRGKPTATGTEAAVCLDIARRQAQGIVKYGQTVAHNPLPLRDWLQHAYEEALDQAIYLKRAISELDDGRLTLPQQVCGNCDSALPAGCEGTFAGEAGCEHHGSNDGRN